MSEAHDRTDERLAAHAAWLARGRTGDGRLVLRDAIVAIDLEAADLRFAELFSVRFVATSLVGAKLDGARLDRCSLERSDMRHASLIDTRLADCDLRRAQIAGVRVERTGFLRCAFGDFASQPIGKPDVRGAYAVVTPDLSLRGDGTRIGTAADIDFRWFTPVSDGKKRRAIGLYGNGETSERIAAQVLDLHVRFTRESGARFQELATSLTFRQFLSDGAPAPWSTALPSAELEAIRATVESLATAWTPPDTAA